MFHKKNQKKEYDKENLKPVIRCSICTGEQVAGFKNIHTGKFEEIMLIKEAKDLERFMAMYGLSTIAKEY
ncbi:MAG: aspartate dehydrogenase [Lachnospiraceae bacterium]|nr:aspartate dehydrogenase [Lachnospiraceae bacterium]